MNGAACCLTVGPVRFVLHDGSSHGIRYDDWAYRDFFTRAGEARNDDALIDLPIHVARGSQARPQGSPCFESGNNWAVWQDEDGWTFCVGNPNRDPPRVVCRLARGLERAALFVDGDPADAPLRYPLDQILVFILLSRLGGVLLHASAVVRNAAGHVFAGRSGAGKSTLSALCHADGWEVLNDDRVILYPHPGGEWMVAGTPWHGSGSFAKNRTVRLHQVYLLHQDTTLKMAPIPEREARLALLDVAAIPWFADEWSQDALHAVARLTQTIPMQRFHFTRSPAAVRMLRSRVSRSSVNGHYLGCTR